jgi:hypothetical protein
MVARMEHRAQLAEQRQRRGGSELGGRSHGEGARRVSVDSCGSGCCEPTQAAGDELRRDAATAVNTTAAHDANEHDTAESGRGDDDASAQGSPRPPAERNVDGEGSAPRLGHTGAVS